MATSLPNLEGKNFIFMTILSFKQFESYYGKKEHSEWGCSWFIKFSHWLDLDTILMVLFRRKKCVKWTNVDTFLKRVNSILLFFQEKLASLWSAGKPLLGDLQG